MYTRIYIYIYIHIYTYIHIYIYIYRERERDIINCIISYEMYIYIYREREGEGGRAESCSRSCDFFTRVCSTATGLQMPAIDLAGQAPRLFVSFVRCRALIGFELTHSHSCHAAPRGSTGSRSYRVRCPLCLPCEDPAAMTRFWSVGPKPRSTSSPFCVSHRLFSWRDMVTLAHLRLS